MSQVREFVVALAPAVCPAVDGDGTGPVGPCDRGPPVGGYRMYNFSGGEDYPLNGRVRYYGRRYPLLVLSLLLTALLAGLLILLLSGE